MKLGPVSIYVSVLMLLTIGCDPTERYHVLSFLFDGVPQPQAPAERSETQPAANGVPSQVRYREHGPYAAKMCNACHEPTAFNALVVPADRLCFKCHDFNLDKKYIHGPLASGGCTACHDPHSSQYQYLLVSEPDHFCTQCHDPDSIGRVSAHQGVTEQCTACHDAHMSDNKYLLR